MADLAVLPTLSTAPNSITRPKTFVADADATFGELPGLVTAWNTNVPVFNTNVALVVQKAIEAGQSQAAAEQSAVDASQFAQAAAQSEANLANLNALWLGALPSDPATGVGGAALVAGNAYVNTATGYLRAYNGTDWVQGVGAVSGVTSVNGLTGAVTVPNPSARFFFATGA